MCTHLYRLGLTGNVNSTIGDVYLDNLLSDSATGDSASLVGSENCKAWEWATS